MWSMELALKLTPYGRRLIKRLFAPESMYAEWFDYGGEAGGA